MGNDRLVGATDRGCARWPDVARHAFRLRFRLIAATIVALLVVLGACSGAAWMSDPLPARYDPLARCKLRPERLPWSHQHRDPTSDQQRLDGQRDARASPPAGKT